MMENTYEAYKARCSLLGIKAMPEHNYGNVKGTWQYKIKCWDRLIANPPDDVALQSRRLMRDIVELERMLVL